MATNRSNKRQKQFRRNDDWDNSSGHVMSHPAAPAQSVDCGNPTCRHSFRTAIGLSHHYAQSQMCWLASSRRRASIPVIASVYLPEGSYCNDNDDDDDACALYDDGTLCTDVLLPELPAVLEPDVPIGSIDAQPLDAVTTRHSVTKARCPVGLVYTKEDQVELRLLQLLDEHHVAHGLFKGIMDWARNAAQCGYEFNPERTTREAQMKYISQLMECQGRSNTPHVRLVRLPSGPAGPTNDEVPVTTFDFTTHLLELLSDPRLTGELTNICVNPTDPFGKYSPPDGRLGSANSGSWYS